MALTKPQVLVFQEFTLVPTELTEPLRAHISGPNADLHRHSVADEKETINVGEYDPTQEVCHAWPGREAGSFVDQDFTKVFIDDALLQYFEDLVGAEDVITPVSGTTNKIRAASIAFAENGSLFPRSSELLDRDVQIGDVVQGRGTVASVDHDFETTVADIEHETVPATIADVDLDPVNADSQVASTDIDQIDGAENCVTAAADGSAYNGLADGDITEVYTVTVVRSSTDGDFTTAELRVTSASGNDDVDSVTPAAAGSPTDIGTRGLQVTFDNTTGSCSSTASATDVSDDDLITGQTWQVTVSQAFEKVSADSAGSYSGVADDTYIVEVTRGGLFSSGLAPQITVTTAKGLDASGPTTVPNHNQAVAAGTKGVTITFFGTEAQSSSSSLSSGSVLGAGSAKFDPVNGLRKGDKYFIPVTAASDGRASTLVLANDLPEELQDTATDLELKLFIKKDIQVAENRVESPPLVNWEQEDTQLCLKAGITAFDPTWTDNGVEQSLPVKGGTVFIEFREFLAQLCDAVNDINDTADLDDIPGPLDPDNPLKWGVFKALSNSNGTKVKYTAVCGDPTVLDNWVEVLDRLKGNDTLYSLVPLTFDREVQNLYLSHANAESSPEAGNWKGCFFSFESRSTKPVVDDSTSSDGNVVLATLSDDPNATGTQFTLLSVPAGNGDFITNGVTSGDTVRYLFSTDGFGNEAFSEFVVDQVLSEDSLLLLPPGHTAAISTPQKMEIHHTLTKNEISEEIGDEAATFSDRRAVLVWPDSVGSAGTDMPGYFLASALAGLVSGVVPHQGLTNVEVAGFDDVSRSADFFNSSQLNSMADRGVWIVTEDEDGTIVTRHALTTDNTDLNRREEMIRRNVDSISFLFKNRLAPFIGRTNVTPSNLRRLRQETENIIEFLKTNGNTPELGSQLIDATITSLDVHPLLKDRVVIVLDLEVPAPLNNIELHLVV